MPQVLKPEVRERIVAAGLDVFFTDGYATARMADIARSAALATASLYRYFPDKAALFEAVVPDALLVDHDRLVDASIAALADPERVGSAAQDLLEFWIQNRRRVAVLLGGAGPDSRAYYRKAFVDRLVTHFEQAVGGFQVKAQRAVVAVVFDNTATAIVMILRSTGHRPTMERLIEGFWSYQIAGLSALSAWIAGDRC